MQFISQVVLLLLPTYLLTYLLFSILALWKRIQQARRIGLPYVVYPVDQSNPWLRVLQSFKFFEIVVNRWLPNSLADRINDNCYEYRWTVKDREVQRLGRCYLRAAPGGLVCEITDAETASYVFNARNGFPKAYVQYDVLNIYGINIVGASDTDWPRHRRNSSPAFNEKNNNLVWQESISQGCQMINHWLQTIPSNVSGFTVISPRPDILKIILQILASAAYGVRLPFSPSTDNSRNDTTSIYADGPDPPPGYHFTFRAVSEYMSKNIHIVLLAIKIMPQWIPRSLTPFFDRQYDAFNDLRKFLDSLIQRAKAEDPSVESSNNLLSSMIRSSSAENPSQDKNSGLTQRELLGNLHIFTIAGHETTATALRFTLVLLAINPEAQSWMRRGIKEALEGQPEDPLRWDYSELFPKLIAPLCVMMETLRLYPPVVTIPKWTGSHPAKLLHKGQTYDLPPRTNVNVSATGLHYSTEYWGSDAALFKPGRWDARNKESYLAVNEGLKGLSGPGLEHETLHKPIRGAFIAFSDGIRSCLGKKFAQVEYVAIVTRLFRDYEVSLGRGEGEESLTEGELLRRAQQTLDGSHSVLTLAMADDIPISFKRSEIV